MADSGHDQRPRSGPFGMGWQGYLVLAIVILATALFAATRRDWTSMLISALVLPLIVFALLHIVSRFWRGGTTAPERRRGPGNDADVLPFLARTNPFLFLLFGALTRRGDDEQYQELLRSGPFCLGQQGYIIAIIIALTPLVLALIIVAVSGQLPTHTGPPIP